MANKEIVSGQRVLTLTWDQDVHLRAENRRDDRPSFVGMQYVSMPLTREHINKLIRELRTARDEAYGPDE